MYNGGGVNGMGNQYANKGYNDFTTNRPMKDIAEFKVKNLESGQTGSMPKTTFKTDAPIFKPVNTYKEFVPTAMAKAAPAPPAPPAPPVDEVAEMLKKVGEKEEAEIKKFKEISKVLKEASKDPKPIDLDIFKKVSELALCNVEVADSLAHSVNPVYVQRKVAL